MLILFSITSVIEGVGISQVLAFLPLYLRAVGLAVGTAALVGGVVSPVAGVASSSRLSPYKRVEVGRCAG